MLKGLIKSSEKKIENLDWYLRGALEDFGPQSTALSTLRIQEKKTQQVIIHDFDEVYDTYASACVISTKDNVRTITIRKDDLKKLAKTVEPKGYSVVTNNASWIVSRVKGTKNNG